MRDQETGVVRCLRRNPVLPLLIVGAFGVAAVTEFAGRVAQQVAESFANGAHDRRQPPGPGPIVGSVSVEHRVLADEWSERVSSQRFWWSQGSRRGASATTPDAGRFSRNRPSFLQGPAQPSGWFAPPGTQRGSSWWDDDERPRSQPPPRAGPRSVGYRTVCVRLCDGYTFPISYGGSEGNLSRDQTTCSNACPGARLYYGYGRGGSNDLNEMIDLGGQSYARLKTANLFRTQYVEGCKCKPHPWEQAAVDRHRLYALEEQRRKGNRAVLAELEQLRSKTRAEAMNGSRYHRSAGRGRQQATVALATPSVAAEDLMPAPRSDVSRGQSNGDHASEMPSARGPSTPTEVGSPEKAPKASVRSNDTEGFAAQTSPGDDPIPSPPPLEVTRPEVPRYGGPAPHRAPEPRRAETLRPQERSSDWVRRAFNQ